MATLNLRYPSPLNVYNAEATGEVIAFCRKESEFRLNKYCQYVPSPEPIGLYVVMGRDAFVTVVSDAEFAWEDGSPLPAGHYNKVPFAVVPFRCYRRAYPWTLGGMTVDNAKFFKPKLVHMDMAISQAMVNRTNRVVTLAQNTANWGTHTADANTINGGLGNWVTASDDPASVHYNAIMATLQEGAKQVHIDTNAKVKPDQLQTVVSPGLAEKMARTAEITNYVRESPASEKLLMDGWDPQFERYGLPAKYRGFSLTVEDAVQVTSRPNTGNLSSTEPLQPAEASSRVYVKNDTTAFMVSRVGGLDGEYGGPSFTTIQLFHHGGLLQVKSEYVAWDELYRGAVIENIKEQLVSNVSGYLFTNVS